MDIDMRVWAAWKLPVRSKPATARTAVVILGGFRCEKQLFEAIKCGASGYLFKKSGAG